MLSHTSGYVEGAKPLRDVNVADDAPFGSGPYSPAIRAGGFVFLSGIGALHAVTHGILGDDVAAQTRQTMTNIVAIIRAADVTLDDVVKMDVYLQNLDDYEAFNEVYAEYFSPPYPARLTVGAGQVWPMQAMTRRGVRDGTRQQGRRTTSSDWRGYGCHSCRDGQGPLGRQSGDCQGRIDRLGVTQGHFHVRGFPAADR